KWTDGRSAAAAAARTGAAARSPAPARRGRTASAGRPARAPAAGPARPAAVPRCPPGRAAAAPPPAASSPARRTAGAGRPWRAAPWSRPRGTRAGRLARTRLHAVQDDRGPAPDPAARVPASGAGRRALGVAVSVVVGRTRPGAVAGRVSLAVLVPGVRVVPVAVPVDGTGAGRVRRVVAPTP